MNQPQITVAIPLTDDLIAALAPAVAKLLADQAPAEDRWLTVDEAAQHLRCNPSRIYALTSQGALPVTKDGSRTEPLTPGRDVFSCEHDHVQSRADLFVPVNAKDTETRERLRMMTRLTRTATRAAHSPTTSSPGGNGWALDSPRPGAQSWRLP